MNINFVHFFTKKYGYRMHAFLKINLVNYMVFEKRKVAMATLIVCDMSHYN